MAKKRPHETSETSSSEPVTNAVVDTDQPAEPDASVPSSEPVHPLMEEVQSFLNLRDELARKLAAEIEATELKLADLKRTAASLFPENGADSSDDRKSKKSKSKSSAREAKPSSSSSADPGLGVGEK